MRATPRPGAGTGTPTQARGAPGSAKRFAVGGLEVRAALSPGHTLCSTSLLCAGAAFVHDTLFMPDAGTARTDFPGGSARQLWRSVGRILSLPEETRLFTRHDYRPGGRAVRWESTVAEQKRLNPQVREQTEDSLVALQTARDRTLPMPAPENDGRRYPRIPLGAFPDAPWA